MNKILIIEDEININNLIKESLELSGYTCISAFSGTEGILRLESDEYDLIILDLMLPGLHGSEVLERGKELTSAPFIILSAIDTLDSKVDLLTLGAYDYITKPFDINELRARVMVQLRKKNQVSKTFVHKKMVMNGALRTVTVEDKELNLTAHEYKILELMLKNKSKIFTKQEIYQYAWDDYYIGEDKTINVHISNIRQKIKKITEEEYIDTIWGVGFRITKS
ncbi:MAG: response regulator transcription factor [Oscillospiraceae bacterium]|nr:response regulator transcription factor [Oscillospiraceae bacterium]